MSRADRPPSPALRRVPWGTASLAALAALLSMIILCLGVAPGVARADVKASPARTFVTNGPVHTILPTASATYIGGHFTSVGPRTGPGVGIDAATEANTGLAQVAGAGQAVLAAVPDGTGGFYIGGDFSRVGAYGRANLAHILANGKVDPSFNPRPNAAVRALALRGRTLYVGGSFGAISGQSRHRIAALDATTGQATSWNPNSSGAVRALVVSGQTIYVGGQFTSIGGQSRGSIAALDATTGEATSWDASAGKTVYTLAVSGGTVYAGGTFRGAGGQRRESIAAFDATTGDVTSWDPQIGSRYTPVHAIVVSGHTVYVGGEFSSIGGKPRHGLAALDATTAKATSWDPQADGEVHSLALSGQTLYVGGHIFSIGGHPRNNIAALDVATAKATSWTPNAQGYGQYQGEVDVLVVSGSTVYAGGRFTSIGGKPRNSIAALDPDTGAVTSWNPDAEGSQYAASNDVYALAVSGRTVYAGGMFTRIGGQPRATIAALDATTGEATNWDPGVAGDEFRVHSLLVSGRTVYAGGYFDSIGGRPRSSIAALDASTGKATAWNPNAMQGAYDGVVYDIARSGQTVYAAGNFTSIGGQPHDNIAALDATTGKASPWDPNASGVVDAIAVSGPTVYAGGNFTSIGGQPRMNIAALDATSGEATSWNPIAGYSESSVGALELSGSSVYAGGDFGFVGGHSVVDSQRRNGLAAFDATTGAATPWDPRPALYGGVEALAVGPDGSLWVGGGIVGFPSAAQSGIARFAP